MFRSPSPRIYCTNTICAFRVSTTVTINHAWFLFSFFFFSFQHKSTPRFGIVYNPDGTAFRNAFSIFAWNFCVVINLFRQKFRLLNRSFVGDDGSKFRRHYNLLGTHSRDFGTVALVLVFPFINNWNAVAPCTYATWHNTLIIIDRYINCHNRYLHTLFAKNRQTLKRIYFNYFINHQTIWTPWRIRFELKLNFIAMHSSAWKYCFTLTNEHVFLNLRVGLL